jgi:acetolactate synthase-1/2/3 large subunit
MKLSDFVMEFIADQGVRDVFMLVGGGAMHLNDSIGRCSRLRYICNLHEQACAVAAEAYARCTGGLGVALITTGPGGTNTITGLAGAWLDSTPVLFISGQVKTADLRGDSGLRNRGVQELDIVEIVRSITKYAVTITDAQSIRYHLEKAVHLARSGRPGPVWIDIPLDIQAQQIQPDRLAAYSEDASVRMEELESVRHAVKSTIELLQQARRPFLWLGIGVRLSSGLHDMRRVLDLLQIPFGLTWPAIDYVPDDHPLLVGRPGPMAPRGANFALQNCDCLLTIGARLDVVCTAFAPERLARAAKRIMVDVDPAELKKMEPFLDLSVCVDARAFLVEMLEQLSRPSRLDTNAWSEWRTRCKDWKARYPLVEPHHRKQEGLVSMYYFTESLCDQLPEGALVVPGSSGNAVEMFLLVFKAKKDQRLFNTTALGPMGFGLPACLGACIATGKDTVCIDGDGGFQMNVQELETIKRLALPTKIFVINNGGYGSIVSSQRAYFNILTGCTPESGLTLPDTLEIAAAYGIQGTRIESQADVGEGIRKVLNAPGPQICEVMAMPDESRQPRIVSYQTVDGGMKSKPMEDLYPMLPRDEFLSNMIIPPLKE